MPERDTPCAEPESAAGIPKGRAASANFSGPKETGSASRHAPNEPPGARDGMRQASAPGRARTAEISGVRDLALGDVSRLAAGEFDLPLPVNAEDLHDHLVPW